MPRPGDSVHVLRFVADDKGSRDSLAALHMAAVAASAQWLCQNPSIAVAVGPFGRKWRGLLADLALQDVESPQAPGGTIFQFDFRRLSPDDWFTFLIANDLRGASGPPSQLLRPPPLGYTQFAEAVQQALRDLDHVEKLAINPLAAGVGTPGGGSVAGEMLRSRIIATFQSIGSSEKGRIRQRVLELSYLGSTSQRVVAKTLNLPFSTYRRYLVQGVQRVVDLLWLCEATQAPDAEPVSLEQRRRSRHTAALQEGLGPALSGAS